MGLIVRRLGSESKGVAASETLEDDDLGDFEDFDCVVSNKRGKGKTRLKIGDRKLSDFLKGILGTSCARFGSL